MFWVSNFRIVYVTANCAFPLFQFAHHALGYYVLTHFQFKKDEEVGLNAILRLEVV